MWVLRDLVKTSAFPRCAQVLAESESVIDLIIILFGREEILKVIFFFHSSFQCRASQKGQCIFIGPKS